MFTSKRLVLQPGYTSSCTAWLYFRLYSLAAFLLVKKATYLTTDSPGGRLKNYLCNL